MVRSLSPQKKKHIRAVSLGNLAGEQYSQLLTETQTFLDRAE